MQADGNILVISGARGDTRRYRTLHLAEQLRLAGHAPVLAHLTSPGLVRLAEQARIAVLHRVAFDATAARLIDRLRAQQALIVLDADDYVYDPSVMAWIDSPDFADPVRAALYRRELLRHRAMLDHCDAISVSTEHLAGLLSPAGKPVVVHRNAYSDEMLALSQQARRRPDNSVQVVIGYASGTATHGKDLEMIRPALLAVLDRCPQAVLWLMGAVPAGLDWGPFAGRVKIFPLVAWRQLPERLAQLDINLAPLRTDNPFNQAKSEIKFMEAALVGVPTVASPTQAFAHAISPGINGMLADAPAAWQACIEHLVCDPAARRAMGEAACRDVLAGYSPQVRSRQAVDNLAQLSRQIGKGLPDLRVLPHIPAGGGQAASVDENRPTDMDLALYTLRNRGLPALAGQVWVYLRRKAAPVFPFQHNKVGDGRS